MALKTKSISDVASNGHHKFTLTITENSTSIANNTSSISWAFKISPVSSGYNWSYSSTVPVSYTVKIGGTTYTGNIKSYNGSSTVTLKSGDRTIEHESDGTKSFSFSFSVTSISASYLPGSASNNGIMELTNIARKATLSTATNFNDRKNPTITYSNLAGQEVDKLQAAIYNSTGSVSYAAYRNISKTDTSYTFPLTDAEKTALQNASQGSNTLAIRFYLKTVIGGETYLSYLDRTFTINDASPVITASVIDTNATTTDLTGDSSKLIRFYSNAHATMSAEAQKGAIIDESLYIIRNGDVSAYSKTHTFEEVEDNLFVFLAEDSRGNIGMTEVTPDMVDYIKLTCNIGNNKPDGNGNMTVGCSGNFFNASFGAVTNTLQVQFRWGVYGGTLSDWEDMTVTTNENRYYATAELTGLDYRTAYIFETKAKDKLAEVPSTAAVVKGTPIFHWGENDFVFEVPVEFKQGLCGIDKIDGDLNITGDLRLKGLDALSVSINGNLLYDFVVEQGTSGSWNYRKWNSGVAECWITQAVSTTLSEAFGSLYRGVNYAEPMNYPFTFISRPRELVTLHDNNYALWLVSRVSNTASQTGRYNAVRPTSQSSTIALYYDIYAIGKWK